MDKFIEQLTDEELLFLSNFKIYILSIRSLKKPDNFMLDRSYMDFIISNQELIENIATYFQIPYRSILNFIYEGEENGKI